MLESVRCGGGNCFTTRTTGATRPSARSSRGCLKRRSLRAIIQRGAYFTDLPPGTKNLGKRLFVRGCADKTNFVFCFFGDEDLRSIEGGRGEHVFYSREDYPVVKERQGPHGETAEVQKELA